MGEGSKVEDPLVISSIFNNFFKEAPDRVVSQIPLVNTEQQVRPVVIGDSMFLLPFTEAELINLCERRIKNKRSAGPDGFPSFLIKRSIDLLAGPLTHLVNLSFNTGCFPARLKTNKVIPIHKKGSKQLAENYRPVALTSIFSRVLEYCFLDRFDSFLNRHRVLTENQFGFRSGRSTSDAVGHFMGQVLVSLERGECPVGVLCDLSRAFDCVNHGKLLTKLAGCGVRGIPLQWISSFLSDRLQYVGIKSDSGLEVSSGTISVNIGVPQGSVLAPVLFAVFINDMAEILGPACAITLYADDTSFVVSDSSDDVLEGRCGLDLERMLGWYSDNLLYLNVAKTHYMRFHNYQRECTSLSLAIGGSPVSRVESAKFLGVQIDQHLNWKDHCKGVCSNLNSSCYLFKNLRNVLTLGQLIMFYHAQVGSRLRYAIIFWGASPAAKVVLVHQKRVIRCLMGLSPRDSCRGVFIGLGIMTVISLYIYEVCIYIYKNKDKFVRHRDIHGMNTRHKNNFCPDFTRLNIAKQSPNYMGPEVFNRLPCHIKGSDTLNSFKKQLKCFLISNCFYSLEEFHAAVGGG